MQRLTLPIPLTTAITWVTVPLQGPRIINQTGLYEFAVVQSFASPTLTLTSGLTHAYNIGSNKTFQVIRVPRYANLTLGGNITAASWNGSAGGVVVLDVLDTLNFNNSSIVASGSGFRPGVYVGGTSGAQSNVDPAFVAVGAGIMPTCGPRRARVLPVRPEKPILIMSTWGTRVAAWRAVHRGMPAAVAMTTTAAVAAAVTLVTAAVAAMPGLRVLMPVVAVAAPSTAMWVDCCWVAAAVLPMRIIIPLREPVGQAGAWYLSMQQPLPALAPSMPVERRE